MIEQATESEQTDILAGIAPRLAEVNCRALNMNLYRWFLLPHQQRAPCRQSTDVSDNVQVGGNTSNAKP